MNMSTAATAAPLLATPAAANIEVLNPYFEYFEQIVPQPPVICGIPLKPLSVGRYRIMARYGVAFVSEQEVTPTAADLFKGIIICSVSVEDFPALMASKKFGRDCERWARRWGFMEPKCFYWPLIGKRLRNFLGRRFTESDAAEMVKNINAFAKYVKDGAPDLSKNFWSTSASNGASGTHWSQDIESTLREYQGWTKEEIDEEPLTKALWDFYKHLANHGVVQFMSPAEQAELSRDFTAEESAEIEKQMKVMEAWLAAKGAKDGRQA